MKKKILIVSFLLTGLAVCAVTALASAAFSGYPTEAAARQGGYSLTLERTRGVIYDRDLDALTNSEKRLMAVCLPTEEVFRTLKFNAIGEFDREALMKQGLPFSVEVSYEAPCEGITYYESSVRYSGLAPHVLGYVDTMLSGVTGIEQVFEERLRSAEEIRLSYEGDAIGRAILDRDTQLSGTAPKYGVAITLDRDIQAVCETAADRIHKGAVVVLDIETRDIVAAVSRPNYDQNSVESYLDQKDSPLVNRCFAAYAPGSVFKLVLSAAALETGIDPKESYICEGSTEAEGLDFYCYGGKAHGKVNLHTALQHSCNCYFIDLGKRLTLQDMYGAAMNFGLGSETELYQDIVSGGGSIGSISELKYPRAKANFSIGQGDIAVTPVQMAGMIATIADNGIYSIPNLVEGFVDNEGFLLEAKGHGRVGVISPDTAQTLRNYMESVVKFGTGREAYSENYVAGAKTGTAQTGVFDGDTERLNYWFCGYAGKTEVPEYVIIVLDEGNSSGENCTPEVFREIAEKIFS